MKNWQFKSEKEQLITERDALKTDLKSGTLTNTERLKTAEKIDHINDKIEEKS